MENDGKIENSVYYGVNIPLDEQKSRPESELVFTEMSEVLKFLKTAKGSRFKTFKTRDEALNFALSSAESLIQEDDSEKKAKVYDEKSPFKGPKPQDMTILRKHIENGEIDDVYRIIWNNPRFLISSGDTPTILQEAFRYNALHICAKSNKANICKMILETLQDDRFMKLMYPDDSREIRTQRQSFITDLYLNMPDKKPLESPLHLACKFGYCEVVEVLSLHPMIDKTTRNKFNETPYDIILQRSRINDGKSELRRKIENILDSSHYVPLYRSYDDTAPPSVGNPSAGLPLSPVAASNPKYPELHVRAFAGPMSPSQAEKFQNQLSRGPLDSSIRRRYFQWRRSDIDKGLERYGRQLAEDMRVPWKEYWLFLKSFVDFKSENGLDKLEKYLESIATTIEGQCTTRIHTAPPGDKYRHNNNSFDLSEDEDNTSFSPEMRSPSCYTCVNQSSDSSFDSLIERMDQLKLNDSIDNYDIDNDNDNIEEWKDAVDSLDNILCDDDSDEEGEDEFYDSLCEFSQDVQDNVYISTPVNNKNLVKLRMNPVACSTPDNPQTKPIQSIGASQKKLFIEGKTPTKLDVDVMRAVHLEQITADKYPFIERWKMSVTSYSEQEMNSWPSPANVKRALSRYKATNELETSPKKNLMESFLSNEEASVGSES
ncbi:ankyrin repeat and LEM domain-containing protein 2-like [Tubulanus polymorphus]|uniref:ankyrin repeat and LEM domain-containing protein 2-like n=1 Tax=Tubulanus polymorphus TaxID=672921 RepID=UPI003DA6BAD3